MSVYQEVETARIQGFLAGLQLSAEKDFMARRRREAGARHRRRLLAFKVMVGKSTRRVFSDQPCPLGHDHYAFELANGKGTKLMCPIVYWANTCQLKRLEHGDAAMRKWAEEHPLTEVLRPTEETTNEVSG